MASDELLQRIDAHMASGNDHTARGNELMAEIREEVRLNRAAYAEGSQVLRALTQVLAQVSQSQRDLQDEIRAQRDAIFRMLDRLDGGAGPAPA